MTSSPYRKSERAMEAAKMIISEEAKASDREWKQRMAEVWNLMKEMRQDKKEEDEDQLKRTKLTR